MRDGVVSYRYKKGEYPDNPTFGKSWGKECTVLRFFKDSSFLKQWEMTVFSKLRFLLSTGLGQ